MQKRALILGATGAMATYLVPKLVENGYHVDGLAFDGEKSSNPAFNLMFHDAKDEEFLKNLLLQKYDVLVDFLVYDTLDEYKRYYKMFLEGSEHYIYLSTYRVYADSCPITESSPRLLDVDLPDDFEKYREYSIYKAEEENFLRECGYKNYTIIRPAITYSKLRFQLTILEANVLLHRIKEGKTVLLPAGARHKQGTMSWASDVADMIFAIISDRKSFGETYTVSTSEHHSWEEIAEIYHRVAGLKYKFIPDEDFLNILSPGNIKVKQQLVYDRCFDRIIDNKKILTLINKNQEDLMPLEQGLKLEYEKVDISKIQKNEEVCERMDNYIRENNI